METKTIHLEMDCIHNHRENTMTCSWNNGEIKIVVDWTTGQLGMMNRDRVIEVRDIHGMGIDEFMQLQEQCQGYAESLAAFDRMAV